MGKQDIVDKILSDATAESEAIVAAAQASAEEILAQAESRAENERLATEQSVAEKCKSIAEGRAATARLDGAKVLLGEKRRVIDGVYESAAKKLAAMSEKDCLAFVQRLLGEYAEEGDEIVFDESFKNLAVFARLPVVKEKNLKISFGGAEIGGGLLLRGKNSDKDLSFAALLAADRAEHEAEIAAELFRGDPRR